MAEIKLEKGDGGKKIERKKTEFTISLIREGKGEKRKK